MQFALDCFVLLFVFVCGKRSVSLSPSPSSPSSTLTTPYEIVLSQQASVSVACLFVLFWFYVEGGVEFFDGVVEVR